MISVKLIEGFGLLLGVPDLLLAHDAKNRECRLLRRATGIQLLNAPGEI
jgi:hypothetical protein